VGGLTGSPHSESPNSEIKTIRQMELIKMTDFVLEQNKEREFNTFYEEIEEELLQVQVNFAKRCRGYANFLKRELELGMFIPCDDDGNVLERPNNWAYFKSYGVNDLSKRDAKNCLKYQKAKEAVLFEGVEIRKDKYKQVKRTFIEHKEFRVHLKLEYWNGKIENNLTLEGKTIEDLIAYNLNLTDNAIKQIL